MSSGLLAPVIITGLNDGGNIIINWVRCSRIPGIDKDSWSSTYWSAPLDSSDERYEVDIINNSGAVVRTLYSIGSPSATYTISNQISDFGSVQNSYKVNVYQTDAILGRGTYRQAIINVSSLKNVHHYFSSNMKYGVGITISYAFSVSHGTFPISFILGGAPLSSIPLCGTM